MLKVVFYKIYLKGKIIIFIDRIFFVFSTPRKFLTTQLYDYNIYDLLDKIYIQSWNILCMLMYMYIHRYFEKSKTTYVPMICV